MTRNTSAERFSGTFDDRHTVRFELFYPHPQAAVWAAITEPDQLAEWFLFLVVEPRVGGKVTRKGDGSAQGVVTTFDPQSVLEYQFTDTPEWPDSTLRFELESEGDGCRMTFTQRLAHRVWSHEADGGDGTMPPGAAAGWQDFFEESLASLLAGRPAPSREEVDRLDRLRTDDCRALLARQFAG